MTYRYKYTCPVCRRCDIINIISHLKGVHKLEEVQVYTCLQKVNISKIYIDAEPLLSHGSLQALII